MKRLRGVRFLTTLAVISGLAVLLTLFPGHFTFEWLGYKTQALPIALFFAIVFLVLAIALLLHNIYMWVTSLPGKSRQYIKRKKEEKFEDLLADGFEAIASGEYGEADIVAALAHKLEPKHPLSLMIQGQAAYLRQDHAKAHTVFARMTEVQAVRFLGLRGLALLAMERSDHAHLESLLVQMYELRPHSPWVLKNLSQLYLMKAQTDPATQLLPDLPFYLHMSKQDADQHQGLLLWIKYNNPQNQNLDVEQKIRLLKLVHDLLPKNPIVASELARLTHEFVGTIRAFRVLYKTYKKAPHRALGECLVHLLGAQTPVLEIYKRMAKLCASHPLHPESCYLMAKAAVDAKLWGQGRYHLTPVLGENADTMVCELMAIIEQAEYPDDLERAQVWVSRMTMALRPVWACQTCSTVVQQFNPVCRHCGEFGTIEWTQEEGTKAFSHTLHETTQRHLPAGSLM